ncbi:hypothetical protein Q31a_06660 [Aureliella helgolandensis]|uniref:Uncharacterized protein n=1 Tax=Aureliella helgolandensis TaxID=2527968 RepID=A0A518G1A9_9BACT|nr:hypothetical protein Q31a_06660 [Aureliella helgolandensis]
MSHPETLKESTYHRCRLIGAYCADIPEWRKDRFSEILSSRVGKDDSSEGPIE